ncbi:chromosome partition protein MukE [Thiococcus pfennigii]|uniref:chromosome partition protein MukE n=1 Tax=Thiococcus pfennigii TaxID=1057 RepID=UPI001906BED9|nr:chromosome partition protein MukE [Thiococcus pfennigii]MBK1700142.1 hypothetical protein [Thiococcus pfennigii]
MDEHGFRCLEDVITDPLFPSLDHRLRKGFHVDSDDIAEYGLLERAAEWLETFYAGYECRLVHGPERYWYLLSEGDLLGHRRLSPAEMLVGQVLALMRMDPAWLSETGWIPRVKVLETLENLLGRERLAAVLAPRRSGRDHHVDERKIREAVDKAIKGLEALGFLRLRSEAEELLPRRCLMRFVDPVRDSGDPRAALRQLISAGEVELDDPVGEEGDDEDDGREEDPEDRRDDR